MPHSALSCPRCSEPLQPLKLSREAEIDWCTACGGAWYGRGELARALGGEHSFAAHRDGASPRAGIDCPACAAPTTEVRWPKDGGARIDSCSRCGGHWLDKGELQTVQAALGGKRIRTAPVRTRAGESLQLPIAEAARSLSPTWIGIGAVVMLVAQVAILGVLRFADLFQAFADSGEQAAGGGLAVTAALLAFPLGGVLVGRGSPGFTVWEPGVAAIPTAIVVVLASQGALGPLAAVGLAVAGVVLAVLGGALGERWQVS